MISLTFYFLTIFYIWSEIYYVYNKKKLDISFRNKDISSITKLDLLFYICKFTFFIWIIFGLWSSQKDLFILLFVLNFIKFPFFHISKKLYAIWDNILPTLNIIEMVIILLYRFII